MKKDGRQNGQHKQHAVRHVTGRGALGVLLCAAMFFTSTAFAIPSTAPGDERAQDGAVGGSRTQISRPDGDTSDGSPSQGSPAQGAGATGNTAAGASASAEESGAAALPGRKAAPQPVGEGETGAADAVLYTDRSGNVGVSKEGYTDAAANLEIHADSTLRPNLGENTTNEQERTGGTLFLELERYPLTSAAFKYYCNEQAWDGKAPFRVTGEGYNIVVEAVVNDFMLENNDTYGGVTKVPPAFSFKMDHLTYQSRLPSMNFWARGNKLVIGSGVTTNAHGIIGQDTVFKIYGGAEHQTVFTQEPKVLYPTNVVVESANWDEVFGGGEDECQIAVYDQADGQGDESLKGVGANVYVEGGTVGTLFGGSRVTANALLQLLDQKALNVYTPVNITVSGGSVTKLFAMNDFTGFTGTSADDTEYIRGSSVHADATVNISGEGAAQYVVGDLYRNLPVNAENQRHVLGTTRANITASNTFQRLNYFDVVHISGTDVVVSANEVIGGSMTDNAVTAYGPDFDGYVGQIAVTNGASAIRLNCTENGINKQEGHATVEVNLIKANRTRIEACHANGIAAGYDVYGGGASNDSDGEGAKGFAGGFVGYNYEGMLSANQMEFCDVVRGAPGKVGPFSGETYVKSVYDFQNLLNLEGEANQYSVYRKTDLTYLLTNNNRQIGSTAVTQPGPPITYNRFDVIHLAQPIEPGEGPYSAIYDKWIDAKLASNASGANAVPAEVYASSAKAVLMLDIPTRPNDESLVPVPGETKNPPRRLATFSTLN